MCEQRCVVVEQNSGAESICFYLFIISRKLAAVFDIFTKIMAHLCLKWIARRLYNPPSVFFFFLLNFYSLFPSSNLRIDCFGCQPHSLHLPLPAAGTSEKDLKILCMLASQHQMTDRWSWWTP